MQDDEADVVIVGAGPAGSSTAIRLARLGRRVTLLDRDRFPRDKACSEYTAPETARQLDALGVLAAVASRTHPLTGTTVSTHDASLTGHFDRAGGAPFRSTGMAIRRTELDAALLARARDAGARVIEGTHVTDVSRDGNQMSVMTRDGASAAQVLRARAVVGADGLRSVVARRAGLHRRGALHRVAFVAHMAGVDALGDGAELHVAPGGYAGINPLGDGVANVAVVVSRDRAHAARGDAEGFLRRELLRHRGIRGRIGQATVVRAVMTTGPFDVRSRRSVGDGVLLVGDAADFFDPFTGEGIHAALVGGELAAGVLHEALEQRGPVGVRELAWYRTLRRRTFLGKWIVERLIGYAMLAPALFERSVARIDRRGLADTLVGVTGGFVPAGRILNPVALGKMLV